MPAVRGGDRRRGEARSRGALAAALRGADPRGGPADRLGGRAEAQEGWLGSAAAQLLARGGGARAGVGCRSTGRRWRGAPVLVYGAAATARGKPKAQNSRVPPMLVPDWARTAGSCRKRGRRARLHHPPLLPTTRAPRRRATRCARRRSAAPGFTSCSSGSPSVEPARPPRPPPIAGWNTRPDWPTPPCEPRSSSRFAGSSSDAASPPCSARARLAKRRSRRPCRDGRVIAGTVDRLLVEDERVSVIDFKTGRVPSSDDDVPGAHRAQMRAYADALRVIFPGGEIRAALLYTAGPKLIEVMRLRGAGGAPIWPLTFDRRVARHGHQDGHRPEFRRSTSSARTGPCSSISGRNGAGRAG